MSLNYNLSKVADFDAITSEKQWPTTQSIIFECIAVGLSGLDAKNLQEFKIRSDFWRKLEGLDLIPVEELQKRIGLTVNVVKETWTQFVKRHAEGFYRDRKWEMRNAEVFKDKPKAEVSDA
jgi:hypothetical protein